MAYQRGHTCSFLTCFPTGEDNVILWEKSSFFNSYKKQVLSDKEGRVSLVKWRGRFAAWSCKNKGVKVYDVQNREIISLVKVRFHSTIVEYND